jgi:excisionase family DNA binding protein
MKTNEIPQANQLDNVHIISLLDRLEAAKKVLEKSEDIESTIEKLNNLEYFLRRFGTLKDLATHMLFIERKMYILKEYLTVTEAADYLNLSPSLVYRLTSKHELPIYKPNGKTIFIRRDDLNRWIAKTRVMSDDETKHEFSQCEKVIYGVLIPIGLVLIMGIAGWMEVSCAR